MLHVFRLCSLRHVVAATTSYYTQTASAAATTPTPSITGRYQLRISYSRFLRATLCVTSVFAAARCLRPSVTFVYCIQTAEDIVKLPVCKMTYTVLSGTLNQ